MKKQILISSLSLALLVLSLSGCKKIFDIKPEEVLDELALDPRYATNPQRLAHRESLCERLATALAERPRSHWLAALDAAGVPCGPVNNLGEVFADPHVAARGAELRMPCDWAEGGQLSLLANPLRLSATPPSYRHTPPRLDEHRDEVLRDWLGPQPGAD